MGHSRVLTDVEGNVTGFACGRGSRAPACKFCSNQSTKLCDEKGKGELKGITCDAPIGGKCAVSIGHNRDLCPPHARAHAAAKAKEAEHG